MRSISHPAGNRVQILQIRSGFACNSSSTHSIAILPVGQAAEDDEAFDDSYGWNSFICASSEAKDRYLASILQAQISSSCGPHLTSALVNEIFGFEIDSSASIDHQSVFMLPLSEDQASIHLEFFEAFRKWLADPRILILGGNDNSESTHGWDGLPEARPMPFERESEKRWIARRDEASDSWTLFCPADGSKIRLRLQPEGKFDEAPVPGSPAPKAAWERQQDEKLSSPELMDIKITDACPYKCSFCYQGSMPKGEHASLASIGLIADRLAKANVFEVALGGGEPTLHPDFPEILEIFASRGIVPNFTTKNLSWLRGPHAARILRTCGAFAFSAQTAAEAQRAFDGYDDALKSPAGNGQSVSEAAGHPGKGKMTIQHVVGVASPAEITKITEICLSRGAKLTLLGYKTNGRGEIALIEPEALATLQAAEAGWMNAVTSAAQRLNKRWASIGVDTALAAKFQKELENMGNSSIFVRDKEGAQSGYVDGVAMTISPSSYSDTPPQPFGDDWLSVWKAMAPETPRARSRYSFK